MWGPYGVYFILRCLYLVAKFLGWTQVVFRAVQSSDQDRHQGRELIAFIVLVVFWGLVMIYPLHVLGIVTTVEQIPLGILILLTPYSFYLLYRLWKNFFLPSGWAGKETLDSEHAE